LEIRGGYRTCESCDFTRRQIYIKSGNMVRKSEKIGKIIKKIGEIGTFT